MPIYARCTPGFDACSRYKALLLNLHYCRPRVCATFCSQRKIHVPVGLASTGTNGIPYVSHLSTFPRLRAACHELLWVVARRHHPRSSRTSITTLLPRAINLGGRGRDRCGAKIDPQIACEVWSLCVPSGEPRSLSEKIQRNEETGANLLAFLERNETKGAADSVTASQESKRRRITLKRHLA